MSTPVKYKPSVIVHHKTAATLNIHVHNCKDFIQGACIWLGDTVHAAEGKVFQFWLKDVQNEVIRCHVQPAAHYFVKRIHKARTYQIQNYTIRTKNGKMFVVIDQFSNIKLIHSMIQPTNTKIFITNQTQNNHRPTQHNNDTQTNNNKNTLFKYYNTIYKRDQQRDNNDEQTEYIPITNQTQAKQKQTSILNWTTRQPQPKNNKL